MFRKILALTLTICLLSCGAVFAENYNNWGNTDTFRLLQRALPYDMTYTGSSRNGVSTIVSSVSTLSATHLAFSVLKLSGASKTFTMAAGVPGKSIVLIKSETDARSLVLSFANGIAEGYATPTAHTGFTTITFGTNAGSYVILTWMDDTTGWVRTGQSDDITITY